MSPRRPARLAGTWYPQEKVQVMRLLEAAARAAASRPVEAPAASTTGRFAAALLPHAGLSYSAPCQLAGLVGIDEWRGQSARVIILTPSHYLPLDADQLYVDQHESLETPIADLAGWLPDCGHQAFNQYPGVFLQEHALELLLPALAWLVPDARVFPVMVGAISDTASLDHLQAALRTLVDQARATGHPCLALASSDISHYGRRFHHHPFGLVENDALYSQVAARDLAACRLVAQADAHGLFARQAELEPTMCGRHPAMLLAGLAEDLGWRGRVEGYYRSDQADHAPAGQWPGEIIRTAAVNDGFVSYAAVRFGEGMDHAG